MAIKYLELCIILIFIKTISSKKTCKKPNFYDMKIILIKNIIGKHIIYKKISTYQIS